MWPNPGTILDDPDFHNGGLILDISFDRKHIASHQIALSDLKTDSKKDRRGLEVEDLDFLL
jgi:hypothetical protein